MGLEIRFGFGARRWCELQLSSAASSAAWSRLNEIHHADGF
jgi:hypothetical protein